MKEWMEEKSVNKLRTWTYYYTRRMFFISICECNRNHVHKRWYMYNIPMYISKWGKKDIEKKRKNKILEDSEAKKSNLLIALIFLHELSEPESEWEIFFLLNLHYLQSLASLSGLSSYNVAAKKGMNWEWAFRERRLIIIGNTHDLMQWTHKQAAVCNLILEAYNKVITKYHILLARICTSRGKIN